MPNARCECNSLKMDQGRANRQYFVASRPKQVKTGLRLLIKARSWERNPSDGGRLAIVARAAPLEMIEISRQTAT
jgi:hypothetical protein